MRRWRSVWAAAILLAGCAGGARPPATTETLDQGWTDAQRHWFHHVSQGTRLLRYQWFVALEQPDFLLGEAPRFADATYMGRFGFLPSPRSASNPDALPIGFARTTYAGNEYVGLTCAACHTGRIERGGRAVRIEGGPAAIDTGAFREQIGRALFITSGSGPAFRRFAGRVLGPDATDKARDDLRTELRAFIADRQASRAFEGERDLYPTADGPGRLDALGRGGNTVFGAGMGQADNYRVADAPVRFPALWDSPRFAWAQYNGSIRQPLARNVAQALGVNAAVVLRGDPTAPFFASSVPFDDMHRIEQLLAGNRPGTGLRAPAWPEDLLGPIDRAAAERGRAAYASLCAGCHDGTRVRGRTGYEELVLTEVPTAVIGTDPKAAQNFVARRVATDDGRSMTAASALQWVTDRVAERAAREPGSPVARQPAQEGLPNVWLAKDAYRARPLNGVWASAPYLHNGSVRTLDHLLGPADQRERRFRVGSREYDPVRMGFVDAGGFVFDTTETGNSNAGHVFADGPRGAGVIGPALGAAQRRDIIEYLKTLRDPPEPHGDARLAAAN